MLKQLGYCSVQQGVRDKARHGDAAEGGAEEQGGQVLAGLKMWCSRRGAGVLQLQEGEMLHSTFERHGGGGGG